MINVNVWEMFHQGQTDCCLKLEPIKVRDLLQADYDLPISRGFSITLCL